MIVVSVALFAVALFSVAVGLLATSLSSCCGSGDSADGTYALIGIVVGAAVSVAGVGLWFGSLPRIVLLALTVPAPAVCAVAAGSSSDLAGLLWFAVAGWLALGLYLYRPAVSRWLSRSAPGR